jgi:hypothetical protein
MGNLASLAAECATFFIYFVFTFVYFIYFSLNNTLVDKKGQKELCEQPLM